MARSRRVSVTPSLDQNKINNILKFTYSKISSRINSFAFIIHIDIVTMGRIRQALFTSFQVRKIINNVIDCYKHHQYLSPEEFIRARLNSYHREIFHCKNKNLIQATTKSSD